MKHAPIAIAIPVLAAALALTGCASTGSSTGGPPPPAGAAANPPAAPTASALAAAPSPTASPAPCLTHSCIVTALEQNLTGLIAEDESVATKVTCYVSTVVFAAAADTYSASCTITYSDGSQASGTGNLDLGQQKVTFQPAA